MNSQDIGQIVEEGSVDELSLRLKQIGAGGHDAVAAAADSVETFLGRDVSAETFRDELLALPLVEQHALLEDPDRYNQYDPKQSPEILWALNVVLFEMSDGKRFDYPTISALGEAENVKRVCKRFPEMSAARIDAALNLVSATLAMELGEDMSEYKFEAVEVKFH